MPPLDFLAGNIFLTRMRTDRQGSFKPLKNKEKAIGYLFALPLGGGDKRQNEIFARLDSWSARRINFIVVSVQPYALMSSGQVLRTPAIFNT